MRSLLALCLIVSTLFMGGSSAWADMASVGEDTKAYGEDVASTCKLIREVIALYDNDGIYFTEQLVTCIKAVMIGVPPVMLPGLEEELGKTGQIVPGAFYVFIYQLYPILEPTVKAALTLAVILLGVGLASGMIEKPARDVFVFLLKLACVFYFIQTSAAAWVFESSMGAMESLTDSVFTFGDSGEVEGRCQRRAGDVLWDRVDCMLDVIIGIKQDGAGAEAPDGVTAAEEVSPDKKGISRGMMHFFFTNMTSSGMGAIIGLLGLYTVYTFLFALIKSLHTYLAAILALSFIVILMPMFVPMLMFKFTRNFFDKWYRIALSFILQPVILFGFLSLMMVAFDTVLVSGNHSITRMLIGDRYDTHVLSDAIEQSGGFEKKRYLESGRGVTELGILSRFTDRVGGAGEGMPATPMGESIRDSGPIPGMVYSYRPIDGISYATLAREMGLGEDDEAAAKAKERIAYAAIILALTCFVFLSMLNFIPTLATDLAGGVFEVPNLYEKVGQNVLGADQAELAARNFSHTVRNNPLVSRFGDMVRGR